MKLVAMGMMLAASSWAQDQMPLFTSSTKHVLVDVAVTGQQSLIEGLREQDFVLNENGQPQLILGMTQDEAPLDIVLVCQSLLYHVGRDANGMGEPPHRDRALRLMNTAANAVVGARPQDRVAIVSYGRDPRVDLLFTHDRNAIASAIRKLGERQDENLVITSEALAIEYAVRMFGDVEAAEPGARTARRRLILLISNVLGVGAKYADEPIIRRLWAQDITLSVLEDIRPAVGAVQRTEAGEVQSTLFRRFNPVHIAQATGGDRVLAVDPRNPADLLSKIRRRYTLWFRQPEDAAAGEARMIQVKLTDDAKSRLPDAMVRARQGYVTK